MWIGVWGLATGAWGGELVVVQRLWGAGAVRWVDDRGSTLLEGFDPPEEVVATGVSASGRYGFCWHRPDGAARRLSLYDLRERRWIRTLIPGTGGDLAFTAGDTLLHTWGCGTNCAVLEVIRASDGRELLSVGTSSLQVSPARRHALTAPSLLASGEDVVLYDLVTGARVRRVPVPGATVGIAQWDEAGGRVTVPLFDADDRPLAPLEVPLR